MIKVALDIIGIQLYMYFIEYLLNRLYITSRSINWKRWMHVN